MQADTLIADKAFDADKRVIEPLAAAGKWVFRRSPIARSRGTSTSISMQPGI
jgi:hypothetical protein